VFYGPCGPGYEQERENHGKAYRDPDKLHDALLQEKNSSIEAMIHPHTGKT
jgi:hypothetical protein